MSAHGEMLLSKIVETNDVPALTRYGIEREHFPTETERAAYDFVIRYSAENRGQAPSYATVTAEIADFTFIPQVSDSYEYLTRELKDGAGKRKLAELFNGADSEVAEQFEKLGAEAFISWLTTSVDGIRMKIRTSVPVGTDIAGAADKFLAEYRARQAGTSFRIWYSKFPSINAQIGGFLSSNMYTWYARSGRGKSVVTMEEAIESAFQGAVVLVWALEMAWFEWMARLLSSVSARLGIVDARIDGVDYAAGFENRAMLMGKLTPEFEGAFETFVRSLNEIIPGRIVIRAIDDEDFRERNLRQLEADIIETKADVVVVDPFYYLDYEANTSKTTGGDAANTSKKLRMLAGRTNTVMHVITQADEDATEKGDDGVREMNPPKRAGIKKTKQVLEDAANVFGIDTLAHEGRGVIEIGKGRNGGEDSRIELLYLPNYGIVREIETGEAAAAQFRP